ncbi:condensation domain-containing protein [Streptomyces sp. NPDC001966]
MYATDRTRFLNIPFSGNRSGTFVLTWGQRWIWNSVSSRAPYYADLNDSHIIQAPEQCDLDTISRSLGALLNRYESFRSRFSVSLDEQPYQMVLNSGNLRVEVRDVAEEDARSTAGIIEAEFNGIPFTAPEISFRAAVVTSGGMPKFIVLCAFHMAMDCHGMVLALEDFRSLVSDHPVDAEGVAADDMAHPVDRARMEGEPRSLRRSAQGIRFWEEELAKFPDSSFPEPVQRPESPRYKTFAMHSVAVRAASLKLSLELGVSTASVIHAMAAALVAKRTQNGLTGFIMAASHRYDPASMRYPGTLVQGVPVAIDVSRRTPRELIAHTHRAAMLAALGGQCDPVHLAESMSKAYGPEGIRAKLACTVNLSLPAAAPAADPLPPTDARGLTRSQAACLLSESRYEYVEGTPVENDRFHLAAHGSPSDFHITLRVDTATLASNGIVDFLRELERSVIDCLPETETASLP